MHCNINYSPAHESTVRAQLSPHPKSKQQKLSDSPSPTDVPMQHEKLEIEGHG